MKKVLIPTKLDTVAADTLRGKGFEVVQDDSTPLEDLVSSHSDTEVLIVRSEKVTAGIIDSLSSLRLVVRAGAGYNTIDIKHARRKNVDVMNTPGANSNAVAEEVIALILAGLRHIVPADVSTRAGKWEKKNFMGRELTGKTIGIVGMGNIGKLVVKRLQGFETRNLAYDPVLSADMAETLGVELKSVEEIFAESDFVSLHVPETDDTCGMVNRSLLEKMKPGAVLVNCARAGIINEEDLRAVKKEKNIVFCNDVYPKDAEGPKSVADIAEVMLPHLGASTFEANRNAATRAAEQTIDYFEKGVTCYVVNKGVPDGLDPKFQELAFVLAKLARNYLGTNVSPHQIETSFYGGLKEFGDWMLAPIAAGIAPDFDIYQDASDAKAFFEGRGIIVSDRETDDSKNYGESMTIDLIEGGNTLRKVSVRGTIAEGNLMISRLNDFDKLYLEASGNVLFFEYCDKPGVIGKVASILGENGINIIDIRAPQNVDGDKALAVIKTNVAVSDDVVAKASDAVGSDVAFSVSF